MSNKGNKEFLGELEENFEDLDKGSEEFEGSFKEPSETQEEPDEPSETQEEPDEPEDLEEPRRRRKGGRKARENKNYNSTCAQLLANVDVWLPILNNLNAITIANFARASRACRDIVERNRLLLTFKFKHVNTNKTTAALRQYPNALVGFYTRWLNPTQDTNFPLIAARTHKIRIDEQCSSIIPFNNAEEIEFNFVGSDQDIIHIKQLQLPRTAKVVKFTYVNTGIFESNKIFKGEREDGAKNLPSPGAVNSLGANLTKVILHTLKCVIDLEIFADIPEIEINMCPNLHNFQVLGPRQRVLKLCWISLPEDLQSLTEVPELTIEGRYNLDLTGFNNRRLSLSVISLDPGAKNKFHIHKLQLRNMDLHALYKPLLEQIPELEFVDCRCLYTIRGIKTNKITLEITRGLYMDTPFHCEADCLIINNKTTENIFDIPTGLHTCGYICMFIVIYSMSSLVLNEISKAPNVCKYFNISHVDASIPRIREILQGFKKFKSMGMKFDDVYVKHADACGGSEGPGSLCSFYHKQMYIVSDERFYRSRHLKPPRNLEPARTQGAHQGVRRGSGYNGRGSGYNIRASGNHNGRVVRHNIPQSRVVRENIAEDLRWLHE